MIASDQRSSAVVSALRNAEQTMPPSCPASSIAVFRRKPLVTVACVGKGGSGKSSVITNLAVAGLDAGFKVGIIDADPQQSAYLWNRVRTRGDIPVCRSDPAALGPLIDSARRAAIELTFIDMPPDPRKVPIAARYADLVLIPMRPTLFDLKVTHSLIRILDSVGCSYAVVLNAAPPIREFGESPMVRDARAALKDASPRLWQGQITNRVTVPHATVRGSGVVEFEPAGPAAREFRSLWAAVSKSLKLEGANREYV